MRSFLLASALLVGSTVTLLVGCSGSSSGGGPADDGSAPGSPATDGGTASGVPAAAACGKTQCDVDHDSCIGEMNHQCGECVSICSNPNAPSSCDDECDDICDNPDGVADCDQVLQDCRGTSENAICVDQPVVDAGAPARDASAPPASHPDAGATDAATAACRSVDPGTIETGAAAAPTTACTAAEINTIAAQIDADSSLLLATVQGTSASCQSCTLTPASAIWWGPLVEVSPSLVMLNNGACVTQRVDSQCGAEMNALQLCELEACQSCSDPMAHERCISDADIGMCSGLRPDWKCDAAVSDGFGSRCFPGDGVTDVLLAQNILTLQCGSM